MGGNVLASVAGSERIGGVGRLPGDTISTTGLNGATGRDENGAKKVSPNPLERHWTPFLFWKQLIPEIMTYL
jgi:hypothetical protein